LGTHAGSRSAPSRDGRARGGKGRADAPPLVSVIVPAWNAEATLGETLASVAGQTYDNIEIVIVDDGSTDRTPDVARAFCASDPRARVVSQENAGVAAARNRGIAESTGAWIAPIDADDLWHPTRIEKMMAVAHAAPQTPGFVYCLSRHIDAWSRINGSGTRWTVSGPAFSQLAYVNLVGNGSGLLASRQAVLEAGGYDPSLRAERAQGAEDMLLQLRLAQRRPVAVVPEHLVGWRQAGNRMSGDAEQMDRSCRLVYRRLAADGTPAPPAAEHWMLASSALDVAEHYAFSGRLPAAVKWLIRSLRLDPLRSGLVAAYRIARSVRRRLAPAQFVSPAPHFLDADPMTEILGDPYRLHRFADLLRQVDARRLERLAKRDRNLGRGKDASEPAGAPVADLHPRQREKA
jgi:hypothetical protein